MGGVQDLLISTLDDMFAEDMGRFKYWLSTDSPEGFQRIGKGKLQNKRETAEIVDLMVGTYGEQDVVKVALHALRKANQNQLAQTLEKDYERILAVPPPPAGQGQTGGPSMAAPGAGPQVSIVNESGKVHTPVISNPRDLIINISLDIDELRKEKVDVILDEDTAHESLILSKNGKIVREAAQTQERVPSKKRFTHHSFVLGKEGFTSGRAYWEVGLWSEAAGLKQSWTVGLVSESARRDCVDLPPSKGYWVLSSDRDNGLRVNTVRDKSLCEKPRPHTLGVFLDYDKSMISFYNVEENSHILTLLTTFSEKVYPLFSPGKGDKAPLSLQSIPDLFHILTKCEYCGKFN